MFISVLHINPITDYPVLFQFWISINKYEKLLPCLVLQYTLKTEKNDLICTSQTYLPK